MCWLAVACTSTIQRAWPARNAEKSFCAFSIQCDHNSVWIQLWKSKTTGEVKKQSVMRILIWMDVYLPVIGGVQVGMSHYLPALQKAGHEVVVFASHIHFDLPDLMIVNGIPVHR